VDDGPPVRHRADQPGEEFPDVRRYADWSDIERHHNRDRDDAPEPPQPGQEPPKPALRVLPDPEPMTADDAAEARPDPVAGVRAWATRLLADIEAQLAYQRLIGKDRGDE
jgi:hypothetical protein